MSRTSNSTDLFLYVQDTSISVRHVSGQVLAEWQLETLAERFMQKLPQLILVSACSEMRGDIEWFKYDRARLLPGTSPQIIRNQIYAGNVIFDLRITQRASIQEARFIADDANLC